MNNKKEICRHSISYSTTLLNQSKNVMSVPGIRSSSSTQQCSLESRIEIKRQYNHFRRRKAILTRIFPPLPIP